MKKAYIKKDKDHDVLGNRINPKKYLVPKKHNPTITIDGRKFFWIDGKAQCGKCLDVLPTMALPDDGSEERQLYIEGQECHCKKL